MIYEWGDEAVCSVVVRTKSQISDAYNSGFWLPKALKVIVLVHNKPISALYKQYLRFHVIFVLSKQVYSLIMFANYVSGNRCP